MPLRARLVGDVAEDREKSAGSFPRDNLARYSSMRLHPRIDSGVPYRLHAPSASRTRGNIAGQSDVP